jgi:hypothetical protein
MLIDAPAYASESNVTKNQIPRYSRQPESAGDTPPVDPVPYELLAPALAKSPLSFGSREIARALLRTGQPRLFPGGGLGLDYAALFKTATRPDLIGRHIAEVSTHLIANGINLLVVPGMSGYPIGSMYSQASGIPAVLLKKQTAAEINVEPPPGAFLIPSYTGQADTLISADMDAVRDLLEGTVVSQIAAQAGREALTIELRIAGADEIIDKATMATAITETAPLFCRCAVEAICAVMTETIAGRHIEIDIKVVSWVTPIIKSYNRSDEVLRERFGINPFAGVSLTCVQLEPPAIGIDGLGVMGFAPRKGEK